MHIFLRTLCFSLKKYPTAPSPLVARNNEYVSERCIEKKTNLTIFCPQKPAAGSARGLSLQVENPWRRHWSRPYEGRDVADPKWPFGSIFISSCQNVASWGSFGCWFRIWHSFYTSMGQSEVTGSLWRHHSSGVILSNFDLTWEVNQWPQKIDVGIIVLLWSRGTLHSE